MNKVITINLNGRAYQLEENGYEALQSYLRAAESKLNEDPDKAEIMSDLEQALAEKLERFLKPHKTVITQAEAEEVIKEMGPVQPEEKTESPGQSSASEKAGNAKRLYRIREGAMFRGVCTGLAAYFNVDVTIVRIIFVVLTILTHGFWILVYLVMMIIIPDANTSAEKAAAFGAPFTAQEFINRARAEYQKFADNGNWHQNKKQWKQQMREQKQKMKQQFRAQRRQQHYRQNNHPFMGLVTAIISLLWVLGLASLISKHMVLGVTIPLGMPLWIAILVWVCIFAIVLSPLKIFRSGYSYVDMQNGIYHKHDDDFLEGIAWLAFFVIAGWAIWQYVPGSHVYFQKVVTWANHVWSHFKK